VVPLALGRKVEFLVGEGPKLEPMPDAAALDSLRESIDEKVVAPVYETVRRVKADLGVKTTLIGFCGAPWTVATYMVAGEATPDQAPARLFAYRDPENFGRLIERLVQASIVYLVGQFKAGAECVQIFDTWAGVLGPEQFERWCIAPTQRIVEGVRKTVPGAKIIGFPRGVGAMALPYIEMTGVDAIGIDWTFEREIARDTLQPRAAVQGNVDPLALLAGGAALDREVDDVLEKLSGGSADLQSRPRHPAADPDRACRADAQARAQVTAMYLWLKPCTSSPSSRGWPACSICRGCSSITPPPRRARRSPRPSR